MFETIRSVIARRDDADESAPPAPEPLADAPPPPVMDRAAREKARDAWLAEKYRQADELAEAERKRVA